MSPTAVSSDHHTVRNRGGRRARKLGRVLAVASVVALSGVAALSSPGCAPIRAKTAATEPSVPTTRIPSRLAVIPEIPRAPGGTASGLEGPAIASVKPMDYAALRTVEILRSYPIFEEVQVLPAQMLPPTRLDESYFLVQARTIARDLGSDLILYVRADDLTIHAGVTPYWGFVFLLGIGYFLPCTVATWTTGTVEVSLFDVTRADPVWAGKTPADAYSCKGMLYGKDEPIVDIALNNALGKLLPEMLRAVAGRPPTIRTGASRPAD